MQTLEASEGGDPSCEPGCSKAATAAALETSGEGQIGLSGGRDDIIIVMMIASQGNEAVLWDAKENGNAMGTRKREPQRLEALRPRADGARIGRIEGLKKPRGGQEVKTPGMRR